VARGGGWKLPKGGGRLSFPYKIAPLGSKGLKDTKTHGIITSKKRYMEIRK